jgi:hypothetical protein
MRFLLVCAGAQPRADGVGDYSRRLAGEISRLGHPAAVLALNDRQLAEGSIESERELRLSANLPWETRFRVARKFAERFQPDFWSLQFVCYGFDPHGLPLGLVSNLRNLAGDARWHAMFHELWIEPNGWWAKRMLSRFQKLLILKLIRVLKPRIVHTSIPYYRQRLESAGVPCAELPLFGNIPVVPHEVLRCGDEWVFAFFGSLRSGWEPEPLLSRIELAMESEGKSRCRFVSIGRLGETGEKLWEHMKRSGYANFVFEKRGELSANEISRELQSADFGIAVSPHHLLGKSGAVAAMREHGLPIIVSYFDSRFAPEGTACRLRGGFGKNAESALTKPARQCFMQLGKSNVWPGNATEAPERNRVFPTKSEEIFDRKINVLLDNRFSKNLAAAKRYPPRDSLPEIAEVFLRSLENLE